MVDLTDFKRLIQGSGHYFRFPGHSRETLLIKLQKGRFYYVVLGNILSVYAMYVGGLKKSVGIEMFFGMMGVLTCFQFIHAYVNRKLIEDIVVLIQDIRNKFPGISNDEFQQNMSPAWKVVRLYQITMCTSFLFYMILPRLYDITIGAILDTPLISKHLPTLLSGLIDGEDQQRDLLYVLGTVIATSWGSMSAYTHVGFDSCLILFGFYYSTLVKDFSARLQIPMERRLEPAKKTARLRNIAAHQLVLLRLLQKMRSLFGYPYALQNLLGAYCIVTLLYATLTGQNNPVVKMTLYFNILFLFGMLTATAYAGQHIADQRALMFNALYGFPWYELSPSDRKYFVTMISASRKELSINFHGLLPLDYTTLVATANAAYSCWMCMKSML